MNRKGDSLAAYLAQELKQRKGEYLQIERVPNEDPYNDVVVVDVNALQEIIEQFYEDLR